MSAEERATKGTTAKSDTLSIRATISFSPELYETLEMLARRKKVSLAWVVRDAAEKYVADQKPAPGSTEELRAKMSRDGAEETSRK
jgi:predicted DNA-binding protein